MAQDQRRILPPHALIIWDARRAVSIKTGAGPRAYFFLGSS
jgi:hypothetical protein